MNKFLSYLEKIGTIRGLQIFQILRFGSFFLTGILLAKSKLGIRDIGCYESMIFLSGAFSFFWVSGLLNGLLNRYNKDQSAGDKGLFTTAAITLYILTIVLVLFLLLFRESVMNLLPAEARSYYFLILAYILFNNPTFLIDYIYLLLNKPLQLVIYGLVTFASGVICVILPVYSGFPISYSIVALILLAAVKNILLMYLLKRYSHNDFNMEKAVALIAFSIPLILSMLVSGSAEYIDGFLVSTHFGSDAFAIFRYGAKEFPVSLLMANALSMAIIPKFTASGLDASSLGYLKKESLRLMHILYPMTIVLMLLSHWIYPIIFRAEFISSASVFNVYLLLLISRMMFPQPIVMAMGHMKIILYTSIVEITVNVLSSYFLMLKFGIIGVAYGSLIAYLTEKILLMIYSYRILGISPGHYFSLKTWSLYSAFLLIIYFTMRHLEI